MASKQFTLTLTDEQAVKFQELLDAMEAPKATPKRKAAAKPKAKKAEPKVTPDWIVEHAKNKAANKALAAALRKAGKPAKGDTWNAAKAAVASGKTIAQAVKSA